MIESSVDHVPKLLLTASMIVIVLTLSVVEE